MRWATPDLRMNLTLEQLPFVVLPVVLVSVLVACRFWMPRGRSARQTRYRVQSLGLMLLAFGAVGLAFTNRSEPRTWEAMAFLILAIALAERQHLRLRRQIRMDTEPHDAS